MNNEVTRVFWSGGMDSTFMVLKYLHEGKTVQPYYINYNAKHHINEIIVMNKLRSLILDTKSLSGKLLDTIHLQFMANQIEDVPLEYLDAWKEIYVQHLKINPNFKFDKDKGFQYVALSMLPEEFNGVAIGITGYEGRPAKLRGLMEILGHLKITDNGIGYFTENDCNQSLYKIFGRFIYPIITISEKEIIKKCVEWNVAHIISQVEFCYHKDFFGSCCGVCPPCQTKFNYKIYEFFTEDAWRRASVFADLLVDKRIVNGLPIAYWFKQYVYKKQLKFPTNLSPVDGKVSIPLQVEFDKLLKKVNLPKNNKLGLWK